MDANQVKRGLRKWKIKEDIVISGMAGRFPDSDSVDEFKQNLYAARDMTTADDQRWPVGELDTPLFSGKVNNIENLDNEFFGIQSEMAHIMDPQLRIILELTYEAIVDSGTDPEAIRGSNTGYYYGSCFHESSFAQGSTTTEFEPYLQNYETLVPFHFDFKGPVRQFETACASSMCALNEAFVAMKAGLCDQAIVTGLNISLPITITIEFQDLNMVSKDGSSKCMDASADGYCRSEAVVALFLQKQPNARRAYAAIVNSRSNTDGYKEQGINFPSTIKQRELMEAVFAEVGIDPNSLEYIEAHVTGTQAGDPVELQAIADVFCKKRTSPLKVGCLKSNMGHSEGSSGLCAIVKAILVLQNQSIPPNLHYRKPNPNIKALVDGHLVPVTEVTPFSGDVIPLNCFGFGGANVHVIIKRFPVIHEVLSKDASEKMVVVCGRSQSAVDYALDYIRNNVRKISSEYLHLLYKVSRQKRMHYRGFTVMSSGKNEEVQTYTALRPNQQSLSFEFSGILLDAPFVSADFWQLPSAQKSISACSKFLTLFGVTEGELIPQTDHFKSEGQKLLYNTVVQIVLCDIFKCLELYPHEIKAYSHGRIAAFYAKDELSQKEALALAYYVNLQLTEREMNGTTGSAESLHSIQGVLGQIEGISLNKIHECLINAALFHQTERTIISRNQSALHLSNGSAVLHIKVKVGAATHLTNIGFGSNNNVYTAHDFLNCLGNLYLAGLDVKFENLYEPVQKPAPCSIPSLSPLIKWNHNTKWTVFKYPEFLNPINQCMNFAFRCNLGSSEDWFLESHKIDGRVLFPATGYIMLAWYALARQKNVSVLNLPVRISDVAFVRGTLLSTKTTRFEVELLPSTRSFVIIEDHVVVCTGKIEQFAPNETCEIIEPKRSKENELMLSGEDIYKELRVRGYDYGPFFQNLVECASDGSFGSVAWNETSTELLKGDSILDRVQGEQWKFLRNWVPFADCALQMSLFANREARILMVPTGIQEILCNPVELLTTLKVTEVREIQHDKEHIKKVPVLPVYHQKYTNLTTTKGLVVRGLKATPTQRKMQLPFIEKFVFLPFDENSALDQVDRIEIERYFKACESIAKAVNKLQVDENAGETHLERYTDPNDGKHALYAVLKEMLNSKNSIEQTVDTPELSQDILVGNGFELYNKARFMKHLLETALLPALHQLHGKAVNITEMNASNYFLCTTVCSTVTDITFRHGSQKYFILTNGKNNEALPALGENIQWNGCFEDLPKNVPNQDIILYNHRSFPIEVETMFKSVQTLLKPGGFLLYMFSDSDLPLQHFTRQILKLQPGFLSFETVKKTAEENNFTFICKKHLCSEYIPHVGVLFRKRTPERPKEGDVVLHVEVGDISWLEKLKRILADGSQNLVWLVSTSNITGAGLIGMVKSLGLEDGGERIRCAINSPGSSILKVTDSFDLFSPEFSDMLEKDLVLNVLNDGVHGSMTHLPLPNNVKEDIDAKCEGHAAHVKSLVEGDLSSLAWVESEHEISQLRKTNPSSRIVDVHYAPVNFKDIMVASGRLSADAVASGIKFLVSGQPLLGFEFSGINEDGARVMGVAPIKALATKVLVIDPQLLWPVPDEWTLEEASTVPVVYSTVYYALVIRGKMQPGESILIHAGAGGVGLAAIRVALSMNAIVYTTVGSNEKRVFVKEQFPELKDDQILHSRSTKFEEDIMRQTNGRGIDLVLNSLAEDKLQAGLRCLRKGGRFLEIGKYDCLIDSKLNFVDKLAEQQCSFHGIMLDAIWGDEVVTCRLKKERVAIHKIFSDGIKNGVVKPLPRKVFSSEQVEEAFRFMAAGKHTGKVVIQVQTPSKNGNVHIASISAIKTVKIYPNKSYILIGGFGGFALEIADWLIRKGAKFIVLNSRRGPVKGYHHFCLERFADAGAKVLISQDDTTKVNYAEDVLTKANSLAPVGGIFSCALVLHDALFKDQTEETFMKVCSPKIETTLNMHTLTQNLCPHLDYFVAFSSIASARGNAGQVNYSYANSVIESICQARREMSLPGLAIQWGFVGDVGFVVELLSGNAATIRGTSAQRIHSCLNILDRFLPTGHGVVGSAVRAEESTRITEKGDLFKLLGHVLGLKDFEKMDPSLTLGELGMDSLMAVEIKQALEREYELTLSTKEIRELKIEDISKLSEAIKGKDQSKLQSVTADDQELNVPKVPTEIATRLNDMASGKPLFVFPPIDGDYGQLKKLAERIKRPVVGINWTYDLVKVSTLDEIAIKLMQRIEALENGEMHDIIGYSLGGAIGLKVWDLFGNGQKKVNKLVVLDADPQVLQTVAKAASVTEGKEINMHGTLVKLIAEYMTRVGSFRFEEVTKKLLYEDDAEKLKIKAGELMTEAGIEQTITDEVIKVAEIMAQRSKLLASAKFSDIYPAEILHLQANESRKIYGAKEVGTTLTFPGDHYSFIESNLDNVVENLEKFLG